MRRIAVINQKGGVGKTTTSLNFGAALARSGRRVVVVDMDAQANLTLSLNVEAPPGSPTTYTLLLGESSVEASIRPTSSDGLRLLPANIDLSGAEMELASAMGREFLMKEALVEWERDARAKDGGRAPADYVIFDCPPSLGLLSINALAAAEEVLITIQTEFLALQGMSKLIEILQLLKKRLNPRLEILGILPCLYDSRLKLAREVLAEIRKYFRGQVLANPVRSNVKLAEAPSFGKTIFEYAPDSNGAQDYVAVATEIAAREALDPDLAKLPRIGSAPAVEKLETVVLVPAAPPPTVAPRKTAPAAPPEAQIGPPEKRPAVRRPEVSAAPPATTDAAVTPNTTAPAPAKTVAAAPANTVAPAPGKSVAADPAKTIAPAPKATVAPAPETLVDAAPKKASKAPAKKTPAAPPVKASTAPAASANAKEARGNSFEVLESYVRPA